MRGAFENADPDSADETAPAPAAMPVFVRNLGADMDATPVANKEDMYTRNLIGGAKGQELGSLKLLAEAYSPDSGSITYMFGFKALEEDGTQGMLTRHDFIEVDSHADTNRTYYIQGANEIYQPVSQTDIENLPVDTQLYEKIAYAMADKPGYYKVNARNRVSGKKTSSKDSYTLYIPYAAMPEVTTQMADHFVISQVDYEKTLNQNTQSGANATSNIEFIPGSAAAAKKLLEPVVEASDGPVGSQAENLSYQWYKSADIYDIEMANAEAIEGATEATLEVSAPGCYAVKIDNHFNNDHTETALLDAGVCRVTAMPEKPTVNWSEWEETLIAGRVNIPNLEIVVGDHDKVLFEWHKITADAADEDPIAEADMIEASGELTFDAEGKAALPFRPLTGGRYYLILENQLNGASVFSNSAYEYGVIYVEAQNN